jgi:hypothetical protein
MRHPKVGVELLHPTGISGIARPHAERQSRHIQTHRLIKARQGHHSGGKKTVRLTPGMAVTVEVKTGTRRVIEYFLSPLMQVTSENLREW